MSHLEEREEKICLNCNAELHGRYCHVCGQENLEPKESFWHLLTHFVYDVTHFDGKFFSTLKYLMFRPGYLATEYLKGRRANYLHPIRMYVFASAIFFVVFFSFVLKPEEVGEAVTKERRMNFTEAKQALRDSIAAASDSSKRAGFKQAYDALNSISITDENKKGHAGDTLLKDGKDTVRLHSAGTYRYNLKADTARQNTPVQKITAEKNSQSDDNDEVDVDTLNSGNSHWRVTMFGEKLPPTLAIYDSLQQARPKEQRDGWIRRTVRRRVIEIDEKYHGNKSEIYKNLLEKFLHSIPQMMFVSVPFVALILQLLYVRRRRQFYYVNHVIFIIYVYIATFVSLLVTFGLDGLYNLSKFAPFSWLKAVVVVYIYLYALLAMHNFYKQGYVKSFFKYLLLLFICSFISVFIVSIFFLTSIMSV